MKKLLSIVLLAAMLFACSVQTAPTAFAAGSPTIVCGAAACSPGDSFTVYINIENNPGIMYLELTPKYPSEFGKPVVSNGTVFSDITEGKQYIWTADENISKNGFLVALTFTVSESVPAGKYTIDFLFRAAYNYDEEMVSFTVTAGTVTVKCSHTLESGATAFEMKYNDAKHWNECSICHEKKDIAAHVNAKGSHDCEACKKKLSDHAGGTATCTEKATCSTCGEKYGELAGHSWGDWKIGADGKRMRECTVCGKKSSFVYGDFNDDGKINTVDLTMLRKYIAGYNVGLLPDAADFNGDGKVNTVDLTMLRKYIAGYDIKLGN